MMLSGLKKAFKLKSLHDSSDWNGELNKIMSKYLSIGIVIAILLNPVFGLVDYFTMPDYWVHFMGIRITVSILLAGYLLYKPFIEGNPQIAGFLVLLTITTQDAYFYSLTTPESIHQASLSYMTDFVGASMVLLWPISLAITFLICLVTVNLMFYFIFSSIPFWQFLAEGGLLVFAGAFFCFAMIVFRYHSVKAMIISKMELLKSNEWMAVQNEIIEEKSAELQRSNNRLKEFAYIVSHDLKTPLRGIKNLAQWIKEDCGQQLPKEGLSHLAMIDKQIVKMENLIRAVLEYSKSGNSGSGIEWIDLDEIIKEVIEMVDTDHRTSFKVKSQIVKMKGTRVVISQVLQNLLSNSIQHNDKHKREIEIEVMDWADSVRFSIADNGPGIHPSDQNKIFDLFQTLHRNNEYESTGIGLPVARKMVEESGGTMWLESEPGNGAKFFFSLPKI